MTSWSEIADDAFAIITALEPLLAKANPGLDASITLATKIAHGVVVGATDAMAIYNQIKGGTVPSPERLQQFAADYEAAYQQLNADIARKLAALPLT